MTATVELNMFSGLPNITWELSEQDAKAFLGEITSLPLQPPGFHPLQGYSEPLGRPRSGYRGVTIDFSGPGGIATYDVYGQYVFDYQSERVRIDQKQQLAKQILGTIPKPIVANVLNGLTVEQLILPGHEAVIQGITGSARESLCEHAPEYLGDTGDFNTFKRRNNCYNYATSVVNKKPGRPAIPGSPDVSLPLTKAKLTAALVDDGLVALGTDLPESCPTQGNRHVAILLRHSPGGQVRDFHCLRLDRTGHWSHKDGKDEVRNVDDNGNLITNIQSAALSWDPELVGFFRFNDADKGNIG
jgi:hypothetical protein